MDQMTIFLSIVVILALNILALRAKIDSLEDEYMQNIDKLLSLFEDQNAINRSIENRLKKLDEIVNEKGEDE